MVAAVAGTVVEQGWPGMKLAVAVAGFRTSIPPWSVAGTRGTLSCKDPYLWPSGSYTLVSHESTAAVPVLLVLDTRERPVVAFGQTEGTGVGLFVPAFQELTPGEGVVCT